MIRMAKKKPDMPPPATPDKPRTADRHRARKTISFPPDLLQLLAELAERNKRPVSWEAKLAIERHLREAKMLPPESEGKPAGS